MANKKVNVARVLSFLSKKELLNWMSDAMFLKLSFRYAMKQKLNLDNPKTFNEKLQWLKIYRFRPDFTKMVDKYAVRDYISNIIGSQYLIPLIGIWDKVDEISWENLPAQFVLKSTHDSGGVVICKDKKVFNRQKAIRKLKKRCEINTFWPTREYPYKNIRARIIAEKYLSGTANADLLDYKLMIFNGKMKCIFVCSNRGSKEGVNVTVFDKNWERLPFGRINDQYRVNHISKPQNFDLMVYLSELLAKDINTPFVRIDFYEVAGNIFFGEITFYPASGMDRFYPEIYDEILGYWIDLKGKNSSTDSIERQD